MASEISKIEEPFKSGYIDKRKPLTEPIEKESALLRFEDYHVAIYDGGIYTANWMYKSDSGEWTDESGKPMGEPSVNFAGKYFIGLHSCGTGCRYYTMTDLSTGQSADKIVDRFAAGEKRPKMKDGREYVTQLAGRADSRLLVAQYHIDKVTESTEECFEQTFLLENEVLRPISDVLSGCSEH